MEHSFDATVSAILRRDTDFCRRFDTIEFVGEGAAAAVYKVREVETDQVFALKVLTNPDAFDESTLERFLAEIRACKVIDNPNVVRAYETFSFGDYVAFTMEFVDGTDLSCLLYEELTPERLDSILCQVLNGLQALHDRGILHRDIKLENILVSSQGEVKLTDLGLMKREENKLTKTGTLLGTAQYLPPEYIRKGTYDQRSDIYAVGLMIYELLEKKRYLGELSGRDAVRHLIKTKFKRPELNLSVPAKYRRLVHRALDPNPQGRFATAAEFQAEILASAESENENVPRKSVTARSFSGQSKPVTLRENSIAMKTRPENVWHLSGWRRTAMPCFCLAAVILAIGVFSFGTRGPAPIGLRLGHYYTGSIFLFGQQQQERYLIIDYNAPVAKFTSGLNHCSKGILEASSGALSCESSGLKLVLEHETSDGYQGYIFDRNRSVRHLVKIRATN